MRRGQNMQIHDHDKAHSQLIARSIPSARASGRRRGASGMATAEGEFGKQRRAAELCVAQLHTLWRTF
eukprot:346312-Pleurochrysis_carterae.AAC.1